MPKGRTFARIGFVLGLAAAVVAWKSPVQAETITVTHWGGQFYGVPYAVAMDKGFFKKNGVDVTGILTAAGGFSFRVAATASATPARTGPWSAPAPIV